MKQGTTYPITLTIPDVDLTGADWVIVSLKTAYRETMEFTGDRLGIAYADEKTTIAFALTQAESLTLGSVAEVDCNWMLDGVRGGALPASINVRATLLKRVVDADA